MHDSLFGDRVQKAHKASMIDWATFFPPGTRVLALPSWKNPRLYLAASGSFRRWRGSEFYFAARPMARLYRLILRTRATAGLMEERVAQPGRWHLGDFLRDVVLGVESVVVRLDINDPARKATAQLRNKDNNVVGYLKYAQGDLIDTRLRKELHILSSIPPGFGPVPLKYGALGNGEALLIAPIEGKSMPATLPPQEGVVRFLRSLPSTSPDVSIETHPLIQSMQGRSTVDLDPWLERLAQREWPIVLQHGDVAPWNMLREPGGKVKAVDWEYGTLQGMPLLDLAHYVLQTAALIYRWNPSRAMKYATGYLMSGAQWHGLSHQEVQALVRLSAYYDYCRVLEAAEYSPYAPFVQAWRRELWESKAS